MLFIYIIVFVNFIITLIVFSDKFGPGKVVEKLFCDIIIPYYDNKVSYYDNYDNRHYHNSRSTESVGFYCKREAAIMIMAIIIIRAKLS